MFSSRTARGLNNSHELFMFSPRVKKLASIKTAEIHGWYFEGTSLSNPSSTLSTVQVKVSICFFL